MRIRESNSWGLPLPWAPNPRGGKGEFGGCRSRGKGGESRQGKHFDSQSRGFCHRLEILDFKAKCHRATRSQGIFFGKCQNEAISRGKCLTAPHPQSLEPPCCWQCHPRGLGKGRGREGGREGGQSPHPSIRSVSMGALSTLITGKKKKIIPSPFPPAKAGEGLL